MGLCHHWLPGLGELPLLQGLLRPDPHTAAGAQLPYPHQHGDLWGRGKATRAARAMQVPQLPASASRLPPPRHGQPQPQ